MPLLLQGKEVVRAFVRSEVAGPAGSGQIDIYAVAEELKRTCLRLMGDVAGDIHVTVAHRELGVITLSVVVGRFDNAEHITLTEEST